MIAWSFVSERVSERDYRPAVRVARIAVECMPAQKTLNTLGVALYRAHELDEAITVLKQAYTAEDPKKGYNAIFLAMAEWRRGNHDVAWKWYETARLSIDTHPEDCEQLLRFRTEAEELLGASPPLAITPSTSTET